MNRAERRRGKIHRMQIHKLEWDGLAPPWCTWCGDDVGEKLAYVPFVPGYPVEPGFYACKWAGRDQVGMVLVTGPDPAAQAALGLPAEDDRPAGFIACGAACAEQIRALNGPYYA